MSRPILRADDDHEILLEAPRGAAAVRAGLLLAAALGVHLLLPRFAVAQAVLGLFALGTLAGMLRVHQLRLDLDQCRYRYRRGWLFARPRQEGGFEDIAAVFLDRHEPEAGLEASRLRSRLIRLEIPACGDGGTFVLGFPMGPKAAADRAADYARRLGVALVDRTRPADPRPTA